MLAIKLEWVDVKGAGALWPSFRSGQINLAAIEAYLNSYDSDWERHICGGEHEGIVNERPCVAKS